MISDHRNRWNTNCRQQIDIGDQKPLVDPVGSSECHSFVPDTRPFTPFSDYNAGIFCHTNGHLSDWNFKHVQLLYRVYKYGVGQGMGIILSRFFPVALDFRSCIISLNCCQPTSQASWWHKLANGNLRRMKPETNDTHMMSNSSHLNYNDYRIKPLIAPKAARQKYKNPIILR